MATPTPRRRSARGSRPPSGSRWSPVSVRCPIPPSAPSPPRRRSPTIRAQLPRATGKATSAMATTVPPRPPASTPPPSPAPPPLSLPPRRANTTRIAAFGAFAAVVVVLLVVLFAGGGGATYQLIFPEAGQLVRGDQVQVGGVPVGSITNITLLHNYHVRMTIHVNSSLVPLHEGTTSEIRVPSLSSVANRYIALSLGPNNRPALPAGSTLPITTTHGVVDLDQFFSIFNADTRKGLQNLIQCFAEQYSGAGTALQTDSLYLPPSLYALNHVIAEVSAEQPTLTNFLVETAKAMTTLSDRSGQLTELVSHANTALGAIGSQQGNLTGGLKELPSALHQGNHAFEELPTTLADLTKLVDVSKPNTAQLAPFLSKLRPVINLGTPVVSDLNEAINKPGSSNDLTEAALALPGLAKTLATASPDGVKAAEESLPVTAVFGPYTPDLEGLIRDFGQGTAYYDANGHYA